MAKGKRKQSNAHDVAMKAILETEKQQETAESEKVTVIYRDVEITGTKATVDGETVTIHDAEVKTGTSKEASDLLEAMRIRAETDPGAPPVWIDANTFNKLAAQSTVKGKVADPALPVPTDDGETYRVRQTGMVAGLAGDHRIVCWYASGGTESIYVGDNASPEFGKLHHGQRFEATVERSTRSDMPIRVLEVLPLPPVDEEQQTPTSPFLPPHLERTLRYVPAPGIYDYEDQIVLRRDFPAASAARVDAGWELFSLTPERRNNGLEYITIWRRQRQTIKG